jgi:phytoene/squalene synthetase
VLITIYRRLLEKMAKKQYDVFSTKVALSTWEKLRVLGKGFIKRLT